MLEDEGASAASGAVEVTGGADAPSEDSKQPPSGEMDENDEAVIKNEEEPPQYEPETLSTSAAETWSESSNLSLSPPSYGTRPLPQISLDLESEEKNLGLVITSAGLSRVSFDNDISEQPESSNAADENHEVTTSVGTENKSPEDRDAVGLVASSQWQDMSSAANEPSLKVSPRRLSYDSFYGVSVRAPSIEETKNSQTDEEKHVIDDNQQPTDEQAANEKNESDPSESSTNSPPHSEPSKEPFSANLSGPFQWHLDDLHNPPPDPPPRQKPERIKVEGAPPPPRRSAPPIPYLSLNVAPTESDDSATRSDSNSLPIASDGEAPTNFTHRRSLSSNDGSSLAWSEQNYSQNPARASSDTVSSPMSTSSSTTPREKAQLKLQDLQRQLAEAKAKGDSKGAQQFLEQSIQIIHQTYLPNAPSRPPTTWPPITKAPSRGSLLRLPSLSNLANRSKKPQVLAFFNAVRNDDVPTIKDYLGQGVSVNVRSENFETPLMQAASHGKLRSLEILKQSGADEFAVNSKGKTVLHLAIATKQMYSVQWLLEAYRGDISLAPTSKSWRLSRSPSSLASRSTLRETSDKEGFRPLHLAASRNLADLLEVLIADGALIEARSNCGATPLHVAVFANSPDTARLLLSRSAKVDVVDVNGMSPLHWAAKPGHLEALDLLIKAGAKSSHSGNGDLPIHVAIRHGQLGVVETLMFHGTDVEAKTSKGDTLLLVASLSNQVKIAEFLLRHSANANPFSRFGPTKTTADGTILVKEPSDRTQPPLTTPLHFACFAGWYEMSALLLDHQALVNIPNCDGKSPLILAAEVNDTNLIYLLIARGAKVNATIPGNMWTAAHIASLKGNLETLQKLYQSGANIHARTSDLRTSEDFAHRCPDPDKRRAMGAWYNEIRLIRIKKARQQQQQDRQNGVIPPQVPGFNYAASPEYTVNTPPMQNQLALIQQLSPPNQYVDPQNDAFPEAPPPYVAGPSAPARLANRNGVYRPPDSS